MCGIFSGFSSIFGRIPFIENTCPVRRKAAGHILLYSPIERSGHGRRTCRVATLLKKEEGRITFAGFSCLPSRFGGRVDTLRTQRRAGEMPDRRRAGRKERRRAGRKKTPRTVPWGDGDRFLDSLRSLEMTEGQRSLEMTKGQRSLEMTKGQRSLEMTSKEKSPTGPSGRGRRTSRNRATGRFPGGGGPPRR